MKRILAAIFLVVCIISCGKSSSNSNTPTTPPSTPTLTLNSDFIRGVDLSFTPEIIATNTQYKDNGQIKDLIQIFKDKGFNTVRLRIWHTPVDTHSSLAEVVDFAKILTANG